MLFFFGGQLIFLFKKENHEHLSVLNGLDPDQKLGLTFC